jgi:2,4-dienoyl-CoA reductase (NADPH2)
MNPALGHEIEPEYNVKPAAVHKNVMIVGAGPAGMECAITAKRRGHDVVVFERSERIGGSLVGYATHDLAHKDDLKSVVAYYEVMAKKLGIEVRLNTEINPKLMRGILHQFDAAVVATGVRIDMLALPAPEAPGILVSAQDVALGRVPPARKLVVIGGGKVGLTLAESLKSSGYEVTVIEREKENCRRRNAVVEMASYRLDRGVGNSDLHQQSSHPDRQRRRHHCRRQRRGKKDRSRDGDRRVASSG